MGDNLLESYNPLYDVHLRQYFALPHMQKHLRDVGLLESQGGGGTNGTPADAMTPAVYARHQQMMELLLRNRERVLAQLADLHKKLNAAEKVEICRRIRSGLPIHINEEDAAYATRRAGGHASRSLSRPARGHSRRRSPTGETARRRRRSTSVDDSNELIKRIEADYRSDTEAVKNPQNIYNRLAASVYKYQYLHKMDDRTLANYKESLRHQLQKLERFRELSFGPNSVAKHQPLTASWFFKRRSLPSLEPTAKKSHHQSNQHRQSNKLPHRSRVSRNSRKSRGGKSQSPPASASEAPLKNRYGTSRLRVSYRQPRTDADELASTQQRLPPLTRRAPVKAPQPTASKTAKLPTATVKPTIQQKRSKSTAKPANGKVFSGKSIQNGGPPLAPKIEQLTVTDQLAPMGLTKQPISPGSSIATSSVPDADGEDDTESRQSVDSALVDVGATEEDRAYSSRSSTSAYADSLNDDASATSGVGAATETRPTPEPALVDADDAIERHQYELPRSESTASLKTLKQVSGVNEVVDTPSIVRSHEAGFEDPSEVIQPESEAHYPSEEDRSVKKREVDNESYDTSEPVTAIQVHESDHVKQVEDRDNHKPPDIEPESVEKINEVYQPDSIEPTQEVRYYALDTEQNIVGVESKESTPPSTPPSSVKELEIDTAHEEQKQMSANYVTSHPVTYTTESAYESPDSKQSQGVDQEIEQIADDENQIPEPEIFHDKLEHDAKMANPEEDTKDDQVVQDTDVKPANVSIHANADVSQLYQPDEPSRNELTTDLPQTENLSTETELEHSQYEPEPKAERKLFKPAPEREYISDEDCIVVETTEMLDEVKNYLQDAESNELIHDHQKNVAEASKVGEHENTEKVADCLDVNDNLISGTYEKDDENDLAAHELTERQEKEDLSFEHYPETSKPIDVIDEPRREGHGNDNLSNETETYEAHSVNQIPVQDESKPIASEQFDEALKSELHNLENTDTVEATADEEYSLKKSLAHRFPSTPQNSFSHLDELDHNFAGRQSIFAEPQNVISNASNSDLAEQNVQYNPIQYNEHDDHIYNDNIRVPNGNHNGDDEESADLIDNDNRNDFERDHVGHSHNDEYHIESKHETSHAAADGRKYSDDDAHIDQDWSNERNKRDLSSFDDNYNRQQYGDFHHEAKESAQRPIEKQYYREDAHHDNENESFEHNDHLCAEKMLLDDEDLEREGKGEITTFDGETHHYDRRSSKHLSHSEINAHFPEDLSPADVEEQFKPEEKPIDEDGREYLDAAIEAPTKPTELMTKENKNLHHEDDANKNGNDNKFFRQTSQSENFANVANIDDIDSEWQSNKQPIDEAKPEHPEWQEAHQADSYNMPQADRRYSHDPEYKDVDLEEEKHVIAGNVHHTFESNYSNVDANVNDLDDSSQFIHAHDESQFQNNNRFDDTHNYIGYEHGHEGNDHVDIHQRAEYNNYDNMHDHSETILYHPVLSNQSHYTGTFLAQPSIEITQASDYGGSTEHVDRLTEARTPDVPTTPTETQQGFDHDEPHYHHDNIDYKSDKVDDKTENVQQQTISYSNGQKSMEQEHHYDCDSDEEQNYNESSKLILHGDVDQVDPRNVYSDVGHNLYYRSAPKNSNGDDYRNNSDEDKDEEDSGSVVIHDIQRSSDEEPLSRLEDSYSTQPVEKPTVKAEPIDSVAVGAVTVESEKHSDSGQRFNL